VDCELRVKDASFANLTDSVSINDTVINIDDTSVFKVGDYVAISDDILSVQGGGSQTRRVASCGVITEIGEGTITINVGSNYNVSHTDGGKVGHCQPVVLVENADNVNIYGSGIINARWQKQYDVEAVWGAVEAMEFGSGIAVKNSDNCKVLGTPLLTLKNAVLHNVVFFGPDAAISGEIGNLDSGYAHDKNLLCGWTDGMVLHDIEAHHSYFEDGVIFYISNVNMTLDDIYEHDNARTGINLLGNGVCNAVLTNIRCAKNLNLTSSNIVANNVTMEGSAYLAINSAYSGGNDITINGITFTDITIAKLINLEGNIEDIAINDCVIDGCNTSVAAIFADDYNDGGVYPQNVVFTGGGISDHTGTKTSIAVGSDVTFVDFDGLD